MNAITKYTYTTEVNPEAFLSETLGTELTASCENRAALVKTGTTDVVCYKDCATSLTRNVTWATKDCEGVTIAGDVATITWAVTVKDNGYSVTDLKVYDQYPNYMEFDNAQLLSVKLNGGSDIKDSNKVVIDTPPDVRTKKWHYDIGDMTGGAGDYVIRYTTKIENYTNFQNGNHDAAENKAWITFDFPSGEGTSTAIGPVVSKRADITTSIIEKAVGVYNTASGTIEKTTGSYVNGYDASAHKIAWTVTVNRNHVNLNNVVVTDMPVTAGQEYTETGAVRVTLVPKGGGATTEIDVTPTVSSDRRTVTYDFVI